jgi:hypothetical protein
MSVSVDREEGRNERHVYMQNCKCVGGIGTPLSRRG